MRYSSFDLWVDLDSSGLRIRANRPETGESASLQSDVSSLAQKIRSSGAKLQGGAREVGLPDRAAPKEAREIGSELFQTIFGREINGLWRAALDRARKERIGVRLRLHLSAGLRDWPWEWLFDDRQGFLVNVTSPPISIVRSIGPTSLHFRGVARIRILVVIAQPRELKRLDVEKEWEQLQCGLAGLRRCGRVSLERLSASTLSRLQERLASRWRRFHVVHFIGHGGLNATGERVVFFEDANGNSDPVDGVRLGAVLARHSSLRLVVLNSCGGGRDGSIPFAGVAQSLIRQQIPAVVAMQEPIQDRDAIRFSPVFYAELTRGRSAGSVDEALSRARLRLLADHQGSEWSIPVLYLRVSDGRIFPLPWIQIATLVLGVSLVALPFAVSSLIDPEEPSTGPPPPSLPATASTEGCPPSEALEMTFVRIPEGTFDMGSKPRDRDELKHEVTISKPFCMSVYEVTRGQWRKIMGAVPGEAGLRDDLPVTRVSWKDVQRFLVKLNRREKGAGYRLASEAEWERGARGDSTTSFSFGDDPDELYKHGNCKGGKEQDGNDGLAPAGSFLPNDFGVFDLHGNASEWVQDWYGLYSTDFVIDPKGPPTAERKVRRGGSFEIIPKNCDAVRRNKSEPGYKADDVGFRLVREVQP